MPEKIHILVVDDELVIRESLKGWLQKSGYRVDTAESGSVAFKMLEERVYDLLFLDIMMPTISGLEVLEVVKERYPDTMVVMITAYGSVDTAVQAMKTGASDYLMKPFNPDQLTLLTEKLMQQRKIIEENRFLREQMAETVRFENLVGCSKAMQNLFETIRDVAGSEAAVLITGETGTGKEVVAKAIHAKSQRCHAPFIALNCGGFPEHLLESELFGYERGAFTGAVKAKKGRLELANGGTLFLDEVGTVPLKMQVDLLRVLEDKTFHRLGGTEEITVDFRVIAATNRNLQEAIAKGDFRQDFFYRLNVISIHIPPLRERRDDIPLLAHHFLERYSHETNKHIDTISREAMAILKRYDWPGNVRELENAIERAVVICKKRVLGAEEFSFLIPAKPTTERTYSLKESEIAHLRSVLEDFGWNITRAAEALQINRVTLHKKIKRYGLRQERQG
ncbi:MAG: sigma-54-dependent Fis family transcriptional regulator [Deltaproteobacteria bacterium]|nr:sigma-54-dependent Fis family transcriptional regulator [Deltaproteobacteria bacterium]MBW2069847.1 sigma-54-dependent Fis family transcriptional regulator [Deltaproteobacteria bacterium]